MACYVLTRGLVLDAIRLALLCFGTIHQRETVLGIGWHQQPWVFGWASNLWNGPPATDYGCGVGVPNRTGRRRHGTREQACSSQARAGSFAQGIAGGERLQDQTADGQREFRIHHRL